jgi:hypothetical protein
MADSAELRVSDEERERAAQEIRDHYAAGRLDDDELSSRLSAAYGAKTSGQLAAVRADLPQLPVPVSEQKLELAARRRELSRRLVQQTGAGLAPFVVTTGIWLASGATGFFWPIWVLLLVVVPLLRNGWRLYGPAPELDRVERHLQRRESGGGRRGGRRRHHRSL